MDFSISFLEIFFITLWMASPLLLFFMGAISLTGLWIGRREQWNRYDSIYYSFITASTVGYGDMRPVTRLSKFLAVMIAFMGLVFTGIVVSIAVNAASIAFEDTKEMTVLKAEINQRLEE